MQPSPLELWLARMRARLEQTQRALDSSRTRIAELRAQVEAQRSSTPHSALTVVSTQSEMWSRSPAMNRSTRQP